MALMDQSLGSLMGKSEKSWPENVFWAENDENDEKKIAFLAIFFTETEIPRYSSTFPTIFWPK